MLNAQFVAGTLFVAFVGLCATGLTWISSTLLEVDKNVAVNADKVDNTSQKKDELHTRLKPMWEDYTGRQYEDNLAWSKTER